MSVRLDAFRNAVLADARSEAERTFEAAARDAEATLAEARRRAEQLIEQARREGRDAAERETRRRRIDARRQARALVLRERRRALDRLRDTVLERLRDGATYERLEAVLVQQAQRQLGANAKIERHGDAGGLVAYSDGRRVDYRLPVLVERAIDELGSRLEDLWR